MTNHLALGVDIGGTNSAFGLVDRDGKVVYHNSLPTKNFKQAHELVRAIFDDLSKNTNESQNILGIGVGAPNGNSHTGNIEFAPNLTWKGIVPLRSYFEQVFNKPTILVNDANAAAIGEKLFGSAKELDDFVVITLGTGLGSGIFSQGELIEGSNGLAGEFGHIRVVPNGRKCGCGRLGCLEGYASSTGVVRSISELQSDFKIKSDLTPDSSAQEVFELASKGDEFAIEIVEYTAEVLGNALADFACFSNPQQYILFGGIAQSGDEFAKKVEDNMEKNILNIYKGKVKVSISTLHDQNAGILGTAANLFWNKIERK